MSKPLVWMHGEVKTPPFSAEARLEAGYLLRMLQEGERLAMPDSRPMPSIGSNCHELRIPDGALTWRIVYGLTSDAVVILEVFEKKTRATPKNVMGRETTLEEVSEHYGEPINASNEEEGARS